MGEYIINLEGVNKTYKWQKKQKGIKGIYKNFLFPEYQTVDAVSNLNLKIEKGEAVALLGPNGAGKSTTIKMICGIIKSTSGTVELMGENAWEKRSKLVGRIGACFGNKTQLWWNLPIRRTFELQKSLYSIPDDKYEANLNKFCEILSLGDLLDKPARLLSFGQRMKAEFVASMLHEPEVVLLDEPTIGLDIKAKEEFGKFIVSIAKDKQTTILLCTHDLDEVEDICSRVVVINKGRIVKDSEMTQIKQELSKDYKIKVVFNDKIDESSISDTFVWKKIAENRYIFEFNTEIIKMEDAFDKVRKLGAINSVDIEKKDITELIKQYY